VVGWQRDVLAAAAAAADADQHLSIGAPVTLAHRCVDCPRKSEVGHTDRSACSRDVTGDNRVVVDRFQNTTDRVQKKNRMTNVPTMAAVR